MCSSNKYLMMITEHLHQYSSRLVMNTLFNHVHSIFLKYCEKYFMTKLSQNITFETEVNE